MKNISKDQIDLIIALAESKKQIGTVIKNHFSGRYILSDDEYKNLPKLSQWERDFIDNLYGQLVFDELNSVSDKQMMCIDRLVNKIYPQPKKEKAA